MSFRDQVIEDLPTFTDVGEFGDSIDIDGVTMACVLVNDEASRDDLDGVSVVESILYARASDFAVAPEERQRMGVGGRKADVARVDEEQGMLVIRLRWFNS